MTPIRVGLISDTHGHLEGPLWTLFHGVERILHAGDIGYVALIRELETIAPVEAIRGNTDAHSPSVPETVRTSVGPITVLIRHKVEQTSPMLYYLAATLDANVVLFGHTHRPFIEQVKSTLFVNPGSASRGRSGNNTAGILTVGDGGLSVSIHHLEESLPVIMTWSDAAPEP